MQDYLNEKLQSNLLKTRVLCARAHLQEVKDWDNPDVDDLNYYPFYYHLGTQISCKHVLEYGFGQGLAAACLVQGCNRIETYTGFQLTNSDYYYSFRLGAATLKEYFQGSTCLEAGDYFKFKELINIKKWDLVLISDILDPNFSKDILMNIWDNINPNGYLILNHLDQIKNMLMFMELCSVKNHKPVIYETKYKLGVILK